MGKGWVSNEISRGIGLAVDDTAKGKEIKGGACVCLGVVDPSRSRTYGDGAKGPQVIFL